MKPIRIGTRGSQLALWQANAVARLLDARGTAAEIVTIQTAGDRLQEAPLAEVGGKRLFVKEIEEALIRRDVDLAVHSAKDLPAALPDGLTIAAVLPREDPRDALVLPAAAGARDIDAVLAYLGETPVVGTSSVRRVAQLAPLLPRAMFAPVRGNVDTRLRKLDAGGVGALVLAAAGMRRLGFGHRISAPLPVSRCIPAPGQGIVAIEIRAGDEKTRAALGGIDDRAAAASLVAERTVVAALGGGCQLPLGAVALHEQGGLVLHAIVASLDGRRAVRRELEGSAADPEALGRRMADELSRGGATALLDEVRRAQGPVQGSY